MLLLAAFGLPFAAQWLALSGGSEAGLPACCRRGGKHHCMMGAVAVDASSTAHFRAPAERCPFAPGNLPAPMHQDTSVLLAAGIHFAGLRSHPAVHAQTHSLWRISRDRSRQKRGPPTLPSLI